MVSPAPVPEKQCGISRPRHDVAVAADVGLRPSQARDHIPVAKDDLSQFPWNTGTAGFIQLLCFFRGGQAYFISLVCERWADRPTSVWGHSQLATDAFLNCFWKMTQGHPLGFLKKWFIKHHIHDSFSFRVWARLRRSLRSFSGFDLGQGTRVPCVLWTQGWC